MAGFLFASGWKMHFTATEVDRYFDVFLPRVTDLPDREVLFLPSFTALATTRRRLRGTRFRWGAQDLHPRDAGAHTGDVSGRMLADLGCSSVMIGHAERRRDHAETDELIAAKLAAARRWSLTPLLCVGDTQRTDSVDTAAEEVRRQLSVLDDCRAPTVVAYEPVWAIGSGSRADQAWIQAMHESIRAWLDVHRPAFGASGRVAYGGSVSEGAAPDIIGTDHVEGLFVGGASRDPESFARIVSGSIAKRS